MKTFIKKIIELIAEKVARKIKKGDDEIILLGKIASNQIIDRKEKNIENIQNAEFKVFSQFGDDGIIQFLVNYLNIKEETFIEFGVEDYRESNTRFLMINNNWKGLVMDGSDLNISKIVKSEYYWKYDLTAKKLFVEEDNINDFIKENGFSGKIGILHIDIDGNDYWIWKKINVIEPAIVIMEYNSVFGCEKPWVIPYDKDFYRTDAHNSNLYWGVSILSLCDLAEKKGYVFIGTNSAGNNAYFVKKGMEKELKPLSAHIGYTESKYRESRDAEGRLTFLSGKNRLRAIKECAVFNTRTNQLEKI
jgi:hypothetical protein